MEIQVDQSGKVEATSSATVIAFSNKTLSTILLSASEKRKLQQFFRESGLPRTFVFRTFAALIFLVVEPHLKKVSRIVIDREYPGQEDSLKRQLRDLIMKWHPQGETPDIVFHEVGKGSRAHEAALKAFRKRRAVQHVTAAEVLRVLMKK